MLLCVALILVDDMQALCADAAAAAAAATAAHTSDLQPARVETRYPAAQSSAVHTETPDSEVYLMIVRQVLPMNFPSASLRRHTLNRSCCVAEHVSKVVAPAPVVLHAKIGLKRAPGIKLMDALS